MACQVFLQKSYLVTNGGTFYPLQNYSSSLGLTYQVLIDNKNCQQKTLQYRQLAVFYIDKTFFYLNCEAIRKIVLIFMNKPNLFYIRFIILKLEMSKICVESILPKLKSHSHCGKTMKKSDFDQLQELPPLNLQEAKTVKVLNRKGNKIPFLNMGDLRHSDRPAVLSVNHRNSYKAFAKRDHSGEKSPNSSVLFKELQFGNNQKTNQNAQCPAGRTIRNLSLLPPVLTELQTINLDKLRTPQHKEVLNQPKRRKSTFHPHCKIILARNSHFPFMGMHVQEVRREPATHVSDEAKALNSELFDLDISRIQEPDEASSPVFVSKNFIEEIPIF